MELRPLREADTDMTNVAATETSAHRYPSATAMPIVEDVPCIECDFCGEQYFDIDTLKKIEADTLP